MAESSGPGIELCRLEIEGETMFLDPLAYLLTTLDS